LQENPSYCPQSPRMVKFGWTLHLRHARSVEQHHPRCQGASELGGGGKLCSISSIIRSPRQPGHFSSTRRQPTSLARCRKCLKHSRRCWCRCSPGGACPNTLPSTRRSAWPAVLGPSRAIMNGNGCLTLKAFAGGGGPRAGKNPCLE